MMTLKNLAVRIARNRLVAVYAVSTASVGIAGATLLLQEAAGWWVIPLVFAVVLAMGSAAAFAITRWHRDGEAGSEDAPEEQDEERIDPIAGATHEEVSAGTVYSAAVNLVMHEGRFISERSSVFLVFSSLLFTAFMLLATADLTNTVANGNRSWFGAVLPAAGIAAAVLQMSQTYRALKANKHWGSFARRLENGAAWKLGAKLITSAPPIKPRWASPARTLGYVLPGIITALWIAALAWLYWPLPVVHTPA